MRTRDPNLLTAAVPHAIIDGGSRQFGTDLEKFTALADEWQEHHIGRARLDFQHVSYHQIIGMGWAAVPFLLERLDRREPGWIYALKCITGEQPATAEMRGEQVLAAWVEWGRARGYALAKA